MYQQLFLSQICSKLGGHICGDYGLDVEFFSNRVGGYGRRTSVCRSGGELLFNTINF